MTAYPHPDPQPPPAWVDDDGRAWFRASGLGLPVRALIAYLDGRPRPAPRPEHLEWAAKRGRALEGMILREVRENLGLDPTPHPSAQEPVVMAVGRGIRVVGRYDDYIPELSAIVDAKSTSNSVWAEWWKDPRLEARPEWAWQQSFYVAAKGAELVVLGVCQAETGRVQVWQGPPPYGAEDIRARVREVVRVWKAGPGEWPACEHGSRVEAWRCSFPSLHEGDGTGRSAAAIEATDPVVLEGGGLVGEYERWLASKRLEAKHRAAGSKMRGMFVDRFPVASIPPQGADVTVGKGLVQARWRRGSVDWEALMKELGVDEATVEAYRKDPSVTWSPKEAK